MGVRGGRFGTLFGGMRNICHSSIKKASQLHGGMSVLYKIDAF